MPTVFHLNDLDFALPGDIRLALDEVFVGPIFDESGIKFALLYNKAETHFLYVLNEEGSVSEEFQTLLSDILVGERTGFAFYVDPQNNRKILIGVHGRNWDRNNYYDGPFDQLPDNLASVTRIQQYIEEAYPYTADTIDKFGSYTNHAEARVIIAPYLVYFTAEDLEFVDSCRNSQLSQAQFYTCITPDFAEPRE